MSESRWGAGVQRVYGMRAVAEVQVRHGEDGWPLRGQMGIDVREAAEEHNAWAVMLTMSNGNMKLLGVTTHEWWRAAEYAYFAEILIPTEDLG